MNTMGVLLTAIETGDPDTIRRCAKDVLKSAFDQLYIKQECPLVGDGPAMGTLLVASANLDAPDFKGEK